MHLAMVLTTEGRIAVSLWAIERPIGRVTKPLPDSIDIDTSASLSLTYCRSGVGFLTGEFIQSENPDWMNSPVLEFAYDTVGYLTGLLPAILRTRNLSLAADVAEKGL